MKQARLRLGIKRNYFPIRVVRQWHRLPGKVVQSLLEVFKTPLDKALSDLVGPCFEQEVGLETSFQPELVHGPHEEWDTPVRVKPSYPSVHERQTEV